MKRTKKLCFLAILLVFGVLSVACSTQQVELADSGLFGEHRLKRIESFGRISGSISGNFFLGIGSVNGSIGSDFMLQFYWEPKPGEIVITSLPYRKFKFIIDNSKETPTVEFVFSETWLNESQDEGYYKRRPSLKANLNDFIRLGSMKLAVVKISESTLEKEVYLPKVR